MTAISHPARSRGGKVVVGGLGLAATFALLVQSVGFLSDPTAPQQLVVRLYSLVGASEAARAVEEYGLTATTSRLIVAAVAIVVGVAGVWALFTTANHVVEQLPARAQGRVLPYVYIGPAVALLGIFLVFPAVGTMVRSLSDGGLDNYAFVFTNPEMQLALRNNLIWLVVAVGGSVIFGLVFAALVDRIKLEALAKTFIFLPLAISMVGAAVIWRFVYAWQPPGRTQIGLINAGITGLGGDPVPFLQVAPLNTLALIVIMIWLQTGFAMVLLSAAIKGVPTEIIEACRIDGASEIQLFFRVLIPSIRPSIITVATTIAIAVLKVFDIVFVMTGGRFQTEVVANRMFAEMFRFRNLGRASALAVVLLIVVIPIMVVNVRNLRRQGIGS